MTPASGLHGKRKKARRPHSHRPGEAQKCARKIRHGDKLAAQLAAARDAHMFGATPSVYPCKFCGGWHVGGAR